MKNTPSLQDQLDDANDAIGAMRAASAAVLGGNCAFVDDDAALLAAYANWAIENGCPRDINPVITDKARSLREELGVARSKMKWQPIETAPKDGSSFLVYRPGAKTHKVIACRTIRHASGVTYMMDQCGNGMDGRVTHWMPLPEPPHAD